MDNSSFLGAHPLLLQALVLTRKEDPTVLILILILLSLPPRSLVESLFSLRQHRENTQRTGKMNSAGKRMMKISMVILAEFVN